MAAPSDAHRETRHPQTINEIAANASPAHASAPPAAVNARRAAGQDRHAPPPATAFCQRWTLAWAAHDTTELAILCRSAMPDSPSLTSVESAIWPHAASESQSRSVTGAGLLLARKYPPIYTFRPLAGAIETGAERLDLMGRLVSTGSKPGAQMATARCPVSGHPRRSRAEEGYRPQSWAPRPNGAPPANG
jgi:hypothetical protein